MISITSLEKLTEPSRVHHLSCRCTRPGGQAHCYHRSHAAGGTEQRMGVGLGPLHGRLNRHVASSGEVATQAKDVGG